MSQRILNELNSQTDISKIPNNVFEHLKLKDVSVRSKELQYVNHKLKEVSSGYIKILFETFDFGKLLGLAEQYHYDPNIQDTVQELLASYLITTEVDIENISIRANKLFKELRVIESFDFTLLEAIVSNKCKLYLKSVKYEMINRLEHELFISLYCLNPLRQDTSCFAYTYCPINATPPIIDDLNIYSFCKQETKQYYYLVYENLSGVKLFKFVQSCFFEEFLDIYTLIVLNLQIANDRFSFSHNNLIADNIIIKQVPSIVQMKFSRGIYHSALIPMIIDFSKSIVKFESEVFGTFNYFDKGVDYLGPNYVSDSYQLLMSCLDIMRTTNPAVYAKAFKIRSFFLPQDYQDVDFDQERKYSFRLPKSFQVESNDSLLDWLFAKYKLPLFQSDLQLKSIYCDANQECWTRDRLLSFTMRDFGTTVPGLDTLTIPEFYSYLSKLHKVKDIERANSLKFDCKNKLRTFVTGYNKELQKQNQRVKKLKVPHSIDADSIFKGNYKAFQLIIAKVSCELQILDTISYHMSVAYVFSARCGVTVALITEYQPEFNETRQILDTYTSHLIQQIDTLTDFVNRNFDTFVVDFSKDLNIAEFWNIAQIFKCIGSSEV